MVEQVSPLGAAWQPGRHNVTGTAPGVTLTETRPGSIVQVAAWQGEEKAVIAAIQKATGLKLPDGAGGGVATETKATRTDAGIVDVSTLGKIAVQGPDAAEFLDRVYTNLFSTLPVGKARYGLMLREDGFA